MSIVAIFWVVRVDLTLAYARMSGRDSWATLALVMGRKFWRTVIAGRRGGRETTTVVAMVVEEERWVKRGRLYPSHALQTHGRSRDRAWLQDSIVCLIGPECSLYPQNGNFGRKGTSRTNSQLLCPSIVRWCHNGANRWTVACGSARVNFARPFSPFLSRFTPWLGVSHILLRLYLS